MSKTSSAGNEKKSDKRHNILTGAWLKYGSVFLLIMSILAYLGISKVANSFSNEKELQKTTQTINAKEQQTIQKIEKKLDILLNKNISIIWNNGTFPAIDFIFSVTSENKNFEIAYTDLLNLGYDIQILNQCLVIIKINDKSYDASCETLQKESLFNMNLASAKELAH